MTPSFTHFKSALIGGLLAVWQIYSVLIPHQPSVSNTLLTTLTVQDCVTDLHVMFNWINDSCDSFDSIHTNICTVVWGLKNDWFIYKFEIHVALNKFNI